MQWYFYTKTMADYIIQSIVDWIEVIPPMGIYALFFGIAYIENLIPPMPGDVVVAFGGYLAADGIIDLAPIWVLTVTASVLGFMTMYRLGHTWGGGIESNREDHFLLRFIPYKYFARGKKWMRQWGQGVVLANRFLAGTRSVISLTAGMSHLPVGKTIISSTISSILWNSLLLALGWVIQDNWQVVGRYLSNYGKSILILITCAVLIKLWLNKKKINEEESEGAEV